MIDFVIDWVYNCNNQRIIRCFLCLPLTASSFFCLEVIIMECSNYPLGIGVAIASIAIILMLIISNPWYFIPAIGILIGLECLK